MISFLIFVFGLAVGSFLNALIYRMEKGESAFQGRSYCPHCHGQLSWVDLIPLASFFLLQGRCRYCKKQISWQYPLVEFVTGILFVGLFLFVSEQTMHMLNLFTFGFLAIIASLLIGIFVYDLKHFIIPDRFVYSVIGAAVLYRILQVLNFGNWDLIGNWKLEIGNLEPLIFSFLSALLAGAFFLAIYLGSRGKWMGFGDVKLAFFMGLFLGWPNILVALFFAFFLGALIGIFLMVSRKKQWKSQVPFGPFLIAGTFVALFWGENLIRWYLNLVLV